jgi:4-hydroxy-3-methylbut-2-enyl diphosphate reductase
MLGRLADVGIIKLKDARVPPVPEDSIVIRSHGVTPARRQALNALGCRVIDATCPNVLKIAGLIKRYSCIGYHIILVGDRTHPEVIGLCGYAGPEEITVLSAPDGIGELKIAAPKVLVLSQTTFEHALFERIARSICEHFTGVEVKNTICDATKARQNEVIRLLAEGCDCIVVVGSEFSKNTKSLRNLAMDRGCYSLIAEDANEEKLSNLCAFTKIGIIAGASTDGTDTCAVYEKLLSLISK